MIKQIRILMVAQQRLVRASLQALLAKEVSFAIVGEAADRNEAVEQVQQLQPDVLVVNTHLWSLFDSKLLPALHQARPTAGILVLTSVLDETQVWHALQAGVLGYLLASASPIELVHAIRMVAQGDYALQPVVVEYLAQQGERLLLRSREAVSLTMREGEILCLLAEGLSDQAIAQRLAIGTRTVSTHVSHLLLKLCLKNRTQLLLYALHTGRVSLEQLDIRLPTQYKQR